MSSKETDLCDEKKGSEWTSLSPPPASLRTKRKHELTEAHQQSLRQTCSPALFQASLRGIESVKEEVGRSAVDASGQQAIFL